MDRVTECWYMDSLHPFLKQRLIHVNQQTLDSLGNKVVKRSAVKVSKSSAFSCNKCSFSTHSITILAKHGKHEHSVSFVSKSDSLSSIVPLQSTRNSSFSELLLQENLTITESVEKPEIIENKTEVFKYTCQNCDYSTRNETTLKKHVENKHNVQSTSTGVSLVCALCGHEFAHQSEYSKHLDTHESNNRPKKQIGLHRSLKLIHCTKCSSSFQSDREYEVHIQSRHKQIKSIVEDQPVHEIQQQAKLNQPSPRPEIVELDTEKSIIEQADTCGSDTHLVKCSHCGDEAESSEALNAHIQMYHKQ